ACVLLLESTDLPSLHPPLTTLLRLRVEVHLLLLPAAFGPDGFGPNGFYPDGFGPDSLVWVTRLSGVFVYWGSAGEQWEAILRACRPSFGLLLHSSLQSFSFSLSHPHCAANPMGPLCLWEEGRQGNGEGEEGRPDGGEGWGWKKTSLLGALSHVARSDTLIGLMGGVEDAEGEEATGGEGRRRGHKRGEDERESLLQLLECMRGLPLLVLPSSLLPLRLVKQLQLAPPVRLPSPQLTSIHLPSELVRMSVAYERAVARHASLLLTPSPHEASLLRTLLGEHLPSRATPPFAYTTPPFPPPKGKVDGSLLVVASSEAAHEGLLWLTRDVWPLLPPHLTLTIASKGWGRLLSLASSPLTTRLRALRASGHLFLAERVDYSGSALLLPVLPNETGVWPSPNSPLASALLLGLPAVSTLGGLDNVGEACGVRAKDGAEDFAAEVRRLQNRGVWAEESKRGRQCTKALLRSHHSEVSWTRIINELLSSDVSAIN
ncbi:MAG: hypothetical protein SGPRY_006821, partial [Prymnesium sp.]